MAIVTRATFKGVKPNIKTFLLNEGYTGKGEQEFDAIPHGYPDFLAARGEEDRWGGGVAPDARTGGGTETQHRSPGATRVSPGLRAGGYPAVGPLAPLSKLFCCPTTESLYRRQRVHG